VCVCVCVCVFVRNRVSACVRAYVCVCAHSVSHRPDGLQGMPERPASRVHGLSRRKILDGL